MRHKIKVKGIQVILFIVSLGFLVDLLGLMLISKGEPNHIFYNFFILIETGCLLLFFSRVIPTKWMKLLALATFIIYLFLWAYFFYKTGLKTFMDPVVNVEYFIILTLSIIFYYRQLKNPALTIPYKNPHFWIVSAYLVYIAGTFFLFLLLNNLTTEEQEQFYVVNFIFLFIKTILLSVAMLIKPQPGERKKFQLT